MFTLALNLATSNDDVTIFLPGRPSNGPDEHSAYSYEGDLFAGCGVFDVEDFADVGGEDVKVDFVYRLGVDYRRKKNVRNF
jgi:hypothetical protein